MKRITSGLGLVLLLCTNCQAGFLHQSMQGTYTNNGYSYTVNSNGSVGVVNNNGPTGEYFGGGGCGSVYTGFSVKSVEELDLVIVDLKHVSDSIHDADKNCKAACK